MVTIDIDRRFVEWSDEELSDPDVLSRYGLSDRAMGWNDLLAKRRVVVLAEAGSGKTEEMKAQARRQNEAGQFAFYASVQDVGREGLEHALCPADRVPLKSWRISDQSAWFFIDSIDEAKLDGVRLDKALRQLAEGIAGAEGRAHIVLSGRHTDWEFRRDLRRFNEQLPIPRDQVLPPPPALDELVISTIRHERRTEPPQPPEESVIVVMTSLDAGRVRLFAAGKGAPNLDAFISEIELANLWQFARRPLDLDWLVQFWRTNNRLGSLTEMLATSLTERLQETNLDRVRRDSLDADRAFQALERIGATLVLGRNTTIAIPDSEIMLAGDHPPVDLTDALPDWSAEHRMRLLTRPVFDPATFGRARLHNDNQGVVRAYLAARWLHRLRKKNLSNQGLFDLLFAEMHGLELVKPSMQETAAWLSLWDADVAREVVRREPFLLLTAGDPASLPTELRINLLTRLVEGITNNRQRIPLLDRDSVKRFSRPDIAATVRTLWSAHEDHADVRDLLLRLIWLGPLRNCADLAVRVAFGRYQDRHTRIVAGRALMATGDTGARNEYAKFIGANCADLPNVLVWDAVEGLFPNPLGIDDLLTVLSRVDVTDSDGGLGFEWQSPDLIKRIDSRGDLERLLGGLIEQLGGDGNDVGYERDQREDTYFAAISAAAYRLLERCPGDEAPVVAVDAVLRIGRRDRHNPRMNRKTLGDPPAELRRTSARRRIAFWRAAERFRGSRMLQGRAIESVWELEILGWSPGLSTVDLDWLLADGPARSLEHERRLAINAALSIWRDAGSPAGLLSRIEAVAHTDAAMTGAYEAWMRPPAPSPELVKSERELKRLQRRNAIAQAKRDQSWVDFVAELRANPALLRQLRPTSKEGADSRLFHLWQLLSAAEGSSSRYAIDSVAPLEPMLGADLAAAFRDGLIAHWRAWQPRLKSAREPEKRNQISSLDCMGIAGVTLEANSRSDWADRLTSEEALHAAIYATLELTGFPKWLSELARAKPEQVVSVLRGEAAAELANLAPGSRCEVLDDLTRADSNIIALMARPLLDELKRRSNLPPIALSPLLDIISRGLGQPHAYFVQLAISRFNSATDPETGSLYLGALFAIDASIATTTFLARLDTLGTSEQTALVQHVLPHVFGDRFGFRQGAPPKLPFDSLERLVRVAYRTIRVADDHNRPSGVVFSPDERDRAEGARGAAFERLAQTPGRATFNALLHYAETADFPIPPSRLRELARDRAAQDSENAPWPPGEPFAFEANCEASPRTPKDLQLLALRRLADMQYDLLHSDFAQGATLSGLPDERAVQNWMADRLRGAQGRSYSVEREPHVVDEKEPDIRLKAKDTDASVPVEIKIVESWTLEQLEAALTDQLCGRYLRARDGRHGILLLVHQKPRQRGWTDSRNGTVLRFEDVVTRLRAQAFATAGSGSDAPQPEIAVLNVSTCIVATEAALAKRKGGRQATRASRKQPSPLRSSKSARAASKV
jgi:hypothetical protein